MIACVIVLVFMIGEVVGWYKTSLVTGRGTLLHHL